MRNFQEYDFSTVRLCPFPVCMKAISILSVKGRTSMKTCKNVLPKRSFVIVVSLNRQEKTYFILELVEMVKADRHMQQVTRDRQ